MTVTKKDLNSIAAELRIARPNNVDEDGFARDEFGTRYAQWFVTVKHVSFALEASNPRFDYGRFYQACGVYAALPNSTPYDSELPDPLGNAAQQLSRTAR